MKLTVVLVLALIFESTGFLYHWSQRDGRVSALTLEQSRLLSEQERLTKALAFSEQARQSALSDLAIAETRRSEENLKCEKEKGEILSRDSALPDAVRLKRDIGGHTIIRRGFWSDSLIVLSPVSHLAVVKTVAGTRSAKFVVHVVLADRGTGVVESYNATMTYERDALQAPWGLVSVEGER